MPYAILVHSLEGTSFFREIGLRKGNEWEGLGRVGKDFIFGGEGLAKIGKDREKLIRVEKVWYKLGKVGKERGMSGKGDREKLGKIGKDW